MNPFFQFLGYLVDAIALAFLALITVSCIVSLVEASAKKVITHYYSTKLAYMQSLAEQPEPKPIPFGRSL